MKIDCHIVNYTGSSSKEIFLQYVLEINLPDNKSQTIPVSSKITFGSSAAASISYKSKNIAPTHCTFRAHNGVLTLHNSSGTLQTLLDRQALLHGKMYILEAGDVLRIDEVTIKVLDDDKKIFSQPTKEKRPAPSKANQEKAGHSPLPSASVEPETAAISINELINKQAETSQVKDKKKQEVQKTKVVEERIKNNQKTFFKSKSSKHHYGNPSFFIRLYAFFCNLSLAYALLYYLLPKLGLGLLLTQIATALSPLIDMLLKKTNVIYPLMSDPAAPLVIAEVFLCYALLDIAANLLLGTSLPLALSGIGGDGSFVSNRIRGIMRSLIHLLTFPLIIFDLPALIARPTIKEIITSSRLVYKSNLMKFLSSALFMPLLFYIGLFAPIIGNDYLADMLTSKVKFLINEQTLSSTASIQADFYFSVLDGNISFMSSAINIEDKENHLIYKRQRKNMKNALAPKSAELSFNPDQEMNILSLIGKAQIGNPLFRWSYPGLFNYYQAVKKDSTNTTPWDNMLLTELKKLLQAGLDLDITLEGFSQTILTAGPFLNGLVNLKNSLDAVIICTTCDVNQ
ncbi:MAG TPA: FHA domain-containing protein [Bacteriovoracaceae bacterium]|nr:FHA domain-containing protein [Bacteriovoracaceae bacterium]